MIAVLQRNSWLFSRKETIDERGEVADPARKNRHRSNMVNRPPCRLSRRAAAERACSQRLDRRVTARLAKLG
jgi:hypothetical protein